MITAVRGVRVGHWTHRSARTGCTVVLMPAGTVASGEVRGGAPGTREWALLDPRRTVGNINAVVLSGGSAFGLAACDGVVRWCEERGVGWPTAAGPVPIVVGMVVFDLMVGDPSVRPDASAGYAACEAAGGGSAVDGGAASPVGTGPIGAGSGATIGKWRGPDGARDAGLGSAVYRDGDLVVAALVVVNALGEPRMAGEPPRTLPLTPGAAPAVAPAGGGDARAGTNTTIGVVVTNARLDKLACRRTAESGHDGLARALDPVHTDFDGDALVVAATGEVNAPPTTVRALAAWVVEQAVLDGCRRRP